LAHATLQPPNQRACSTDQFGSVYNVKGYAGHQSHTITAPAHLINRPNRGAAFGLCAGGDTPATVVAIVVHR
jgi:hypothetical protein